MNNANSYFKMKSSLPSPSSFRKLPISRYCNNFAITPSRLAWKMRVYITRIKFVRTVWIFREKIENSSSGALVLHMTSNLIISRQLIGSFSNDDGNGNENVISRHKFVLLQSLRDYSKLFNKTKVWQALRNETVMIGA